MKGRENIRIHGINESGSNEDDGEIIIKKFTEQIGVKINNMTFKEPTELGKTDQSVNDEKQLFGSRLTKSEMIFYIRNPN